MVFACSVVQLLLTGRQRDVMVLLWGRSYDDDDDDDDDYYYY